MCTVRTELSSLKERHIVRTEEDEEMENTRTGDRRRTVRGRRRDGRRTALSRQETLCVSLLLHVCRSQLFELRFWNLIIKCFDSSLRGVVLLLLNCEAQKQ